MAIAALKRKAKSCKTKEMGKIYHERVEVDNIKFHSKTEAEFYQYITLNKEAMGIKEIELQPEFLLQEKYLLVENKVILCNDEKEFKKLQRKYPGCTVQPIKYISDFKITFNSGRVDIVDVKGMKTVDFRIKEKMFNFKYPQYGGLKCVSKFRGEWLTIQEIDAIKKAEKKAKTNLVNKSQSNKKRKTRKK